MKCVLASLFALTALAGFSVVCAEPDADGHVNFFLGMKSLASDDWTPTDDQGELGVVMSFGRDDWPVHVAVDALISADEETLADPLLGLVTLTSTTFEIDVGVRKIWKKGRVLPYLGAGVGIIGAGAEVDAGFASVDASDAAIGFWADGGLFWRLGTRFNIGLDLRWSDAEVDLDFGAGNVARDVGSGGLHYGLLMGFGW